jgi:hypothetical protein
MLVNLLSPPKLLRRYSMDVLDLRTVDVTKRNRLDFSLYISEADFEDLIRILSDARSRATELAASIGARLGTEHRLAELANAASSRIENMLREVRVSATESSEPAGGLAELQGALQSEVQPVSPAPTSPTQPPARPDPTAAIAAQAGLEPEHWLLMFIRDLTAQLGSSGGINFEVAERLLQQRKDDFLRDFLIARRMYRTYPRLFPELQAAEGQATPKTLPQ